MRGINYQGVSFEQANPSLDAQKHRALLQQQLLANQLAQVRNQYAQPNAQQDLLTKQLNNQKMQELMRFLVPEAQEKLTHAQQENKFYPQDKQSEIDYRNANTNKVNTMTPLEADAKKLENEWYGRKTQQEIDSKRQLAASRQSGAGLGVDSQRELNLMQNVAKDNPNLPPERIREATNAIMDNKTKLEDGTPLNISALTRRSRDSAAVTGTTSSLINSNINAKQADVEIEVLGKYAQQGLAAYGDTLAGYSPKQIQDSFKTDKESQDRLGRFIASQALQYEIAQNRIKLANGKPGVKSTQELIHLSQQNLKTSYPRLSAQARQAAANYIDEALRAGQKARLSVGIGAANARNMQSGGQPPVNYSATGQTVPIRKLKGGGTAELINGEWIRKS